MRLKRSIIVLLSAFAAVIGTGAAAQTPEGQFPPQAWPMQPQGQFPMPPQGQFPMQPQGQFPMQPQQPLMPPPAMQTMPVQLDPVIAQALNNLWMFNQQVCATGNAMGCSNLQQIQFMAQQFTMLQGACNQGDPNACQYITMTRNQLLGAMQQPGMMVPQPGLQPQGMVPPPGMVPQGMVPQGMVPQGMVPQTMPQVMAPQGPDWTDQ